MNKFPLNLAPGASVPIFGRGRFVYFESASAGGVDTSISVSTRGDGVSQTILQVGQGFKLTSDFEQLIVSNNLGQGTIIGFLVISDGDFFDHRTIGTVSVVDGGRSRTLANLAFCMPFAGPAVAAALSTAQVWNPAASVRRVVIESFAVSASAACVFEFGTNNVAIAAAVATNATKLAGGVAGSAQSATANPAGLPAGFVVNGALNATTTPLIINLREPIILPPGFGFVVQLQSVNIGLTLTTEYTEEAL